MFDLYGYFVAPERRGPPVTLFRGCFVLDLLSVNIIIIFVCGYKQNRDLPIVLHISPQTFQQRSFAHFLLFSFGIPPKILLAYPFGKNYQNQIYSNKAAICPCCKCLFKKHFVSGLLLHLPVWAGVLLVLLSRSLQHFPSQWPRTLSDYHHGDAVK